MFPAFPIPTVKVCIEPPLIDKKLLIIFISPPLPSAKIIPSRSLKLLELVKRTPLDMPELKPFIVIVSAVRLIFPAFPIPSISELISPPYY
jgi:hypothetical protein